MAPSKPGVQHLTIRQIAQTTRKHSEAPFMLGNVPITNSVIVVANVLSSNRKDSTTIDYQLVDGTWGAMQGTQWVDAKADTLQLESLQYVRVLGRVHHYKTFRSINIDEIQPIENPHEVLYHILRTMAEPLMMARGSPPSHAWSTPVTPPPVKLERHSDELDQELAREAHRLVVSSPSKPPTPSRPASNSPMPLPRLNLIQSQASGSVTAATEISVHSDPFNNLTALQRDIMLCVMEDTTNAHPQSNHIYPSLRERSSVHWVSLDSLMTSIQNNPRHRAVTSGVFIAIDFLVSEGYFNETPEGDSFSIAQRKP